jgi:hypothetical protein
MVDPVPRSIRSKRKVTYGISVDFVIESKEDTEASVCEDGMRRFRENVIVRKTFCRCESFGRQELLDGEVRELYNLASCPVDDGDETRTCGNNRFF